MLTIEVKEDAELDDRLIERGIHHAPSENLSIFEACELVRQDKAEIIELP